jgi:20S proteasome alpha/beta subunit
MILDDNKLLGLSGEAGDRMQYGDYIQKNIHLYKFRNSQKLNTRECANWIRFIFFLFFGIFLGNIYSLCILNSMKKKILAFKNC